ncbi:MAG: hypothetical protein H0U74_13635 [Bradymonadaceae bacterium]|nr:hypothetical protein [Lujinxingiaceae bacterium]
MAWALAVPILLGVASAGCQTSTRAVVSSTGAPVEAGVGVDKAPLEARDRWTQADFRQRWLEVLPAMPLVDNGGQEMVRELVGVIQDRTSAFEHTIHHADLYVVHPTIDAAYLAPYEDVGLLRFGRDEGLEQSTEAVFLAVRARVGWYVLPLFEYRAQAHERSGTGWSRVSIGEVRYEEVVAGSLPELIVQVKFFGQARASAEAPCVRQRIDLAVIVEHHDGIPNLRAVIPTNQAYDCDPQMACHGSYFDYIEQKRSTEYLSPGALEVTPTGTLRVTQGQTARVVDYRLDYEYVEDLGDALVSEQAHGALCPPEAIAIPWSGWADRN